MTRRHISSGSKYEELASYSRAVVDDDWIFVSGTTGFDYESGDISDDPAEQTEQCFRNIRKALAEAGSSLDDAVRIRIFLAEAQDFDVVVPVIGQHMRSVRAANTTVVAPLIDSRMKIEIEITAKRRD